MKKKYILIGTAAALFAAIGIFLFCRPELLGSIADSCTEPTTTSSDISFTGTAGEKINFSFRSEVKGGSLDVVLYDSKGNAVFKLDQAKALECFFTLKETDTYTLTAQCRNFAGNYKVKVHRAD